MSIRMTEIQQYLLQLRKLRHQMIHQTVLMVHHMMVHHMMVHHMMMIHRIDQFIGEPLQLLAQPIRTLQAKIT